MFTACLQCRRPSVISIHSLHAAAGFPTKDLWIKAIKNGNYATWPGITVEAVNKHFPESVETQEGHMKKAKAECEINQTKSNCGRRPRRSWTHPSYHQQAKHIGKSLQCEWDSIHRSNWALSSPVKSSSGKHCSWCTTTSMQITSMPNQLEAIRTLSWLLCIKNYGSNKLRLEEQTKSAYLGQRGIRSV